MAHLRICVTGLLPALLLAGSAPAGSLQGPVRGEIRLGDGAV
jgi:hypothetical protein